MTKITTSCELPSIHQPMYAPVTYNSSQYTNERHPLNQHGRFSPANMQLIGNRSMAWLSVMLKLSFSLSRPVDKDVLQSMTGALSPDWYAGIVRRDQSAKLLSDMCEHNLIRRVHPNVHRGDASRLYYVNPHVLHIMTRGQRLEYIRKHSDMFGPVTL